MPNETQIIVPIEKTSIERDRVSSFMRGGFAVGVGLLIGLLVIGVPSPIMILAAAVGLLMVIIAIAKIEWALYLFVFIIYTRFSNVAIEYHGMPSVAKIFVVLLILGILVRWALYDERPRGWAQLVLLVMIYGLVCIASMTYAADVNRTSSTVIFWVKDSIIAFIVVILLKRAELLRGVVWALLAAGIFLGTIGACQHLTGTFTNTYWGFGLAVVKDIAEATVGYRISGPISGPNFFAQFLLPLIPLALDRLRAERKFIFRFLAVWGLAVCTLSVFFTYSRGGFLGLIMMLIVFMMLHPPRPKVVFISIAIAIPLLYFAPPQYFDRIITLRNVMPGTKGDATSDDAFRGRKSEMIVAWHMFFDHPIRGVGFGNYEVYYQKYSRKIFLDSRLEEREAHSRYLEILAETGILGFTSFSMLLWMMFLGLWRARKVAAKWGLVDLKGTATALGVGMVGFLTASIFLHDAYARFFWLLMGIAFAVPNIVRHESMVQSGNLDAVDSVT